MKMKCRFLFSAYCLILVYIYTKFHENTLNGIRVMERTRNVNGRTDGQRARHNTTRLRLHPTACFFFVFLKAGYITGRPKAMLLLRCCPNF